MTIKEDVVAAAVQEWNNTNNDVARTGDPSGWRRFEMVARGFGFRSAAARDQSQLDDAAWIQAAQRWQGALDHYHQEIESLESDVVDGVGPVWGVYVEDFRHKSQPTEHARVRFTQVMTRDDDGWKVILYHRDIQPFDANGQYPRSLTTSEDHG